MTNSVPLKSLHSFAIDARAKRVIVARTEAELLAFWQKAAEDATPILLLGGGSNVLFLENYSGTVLLNRIAGVAIQEGKDAWHLHVGAGEIWHDLVSLCLEKCMPGLENLALIPGCVGAAPIQNIGAYGAELQQFCEYVDVLQLKTGVMCRQRADECQFGYRESVFKHALREHHAIIAVGLQLSKVWRPILNYGDLACLNAEKTTPRKIYDTVCEMRRKKLPDPALHGNAGSFFKNPIIDAQAAKRLLKCYPDAPHHPQPGGGVKLAAGWLIDCCGLKGYSLGGAAVHDKQALILINADNAIGKDIATLARYVRRKVMEYFSVRLEPEVRFIGSDGEVDAGGVIT
ncbi:MAG: UDP-N-acetylmuramate dehydrogenase [Sodalis sp. (in: enterobacteria)]